MMESAPLTKTLIFLSGVLTITVIHFQALENSRIFKSSNLKVTGLKSFYVISV